MSMEGNSSVNRSVWNFFSGSRITFGPGATASLANVIQRCHAKRVLVISDRVLESAGIVARVDAAIQQASVPYEWFLDGEVEPSTATIAKAVETATDFEPDLFVALGGGSNMDLAKAVVAVYSHDNMIVQLAKSPSRRDKGDIN